MKKLIFSLLICLLAPLAIHSQSFNQEQTALKNYLIRMYNAEPFEGVQVVQDYENYYLVSVVSLVRNEGVTNQSLNRVAQVKSQRQVAQYMSSHTKTSSQTIIKMCEDAKSDMSIAEVIEIISEVTVGTTKAMSTLATFDSADGSERTYIFYRKLDEMKSK